MQIGRAFCLNLQFHIYQVSNITVTKAKRDAGPKDEGDGIFRHP
jgi:hypothetical protein